MKPRGHVQIEYDNVKLFDEHGKELVCWIIDEWRADPDILPTVCNAVRLALTDLPTLKKHLAVTPKPDKRSIFYKE